MQFRDGVIDAIGHTPLIKLKRVSEATGCMILGKAEFMNPGGSVKDRAGRQMILEVHTKGKPFEKDVELGVLARQTPGFSGADLANLVNEAAILAARRNKKKIGMGEFNEAVDRVIAGPERKSRVITPKEKEIIAYHEAGHALVAWRTPAADPVHKVTIIPRGRALGVTEQMPEEEHYNYSRVYLLSRLQVMLAGRTAEEIVFGDVTTGAENDLIEATRLARRMVTRWGMGSLGPVAFEADGVGDLR